MPLQVFFNLYPLMNISLKKFVITPTMAVLLGHSLAYGADFVDKPLTPKFNVSQELGGEARNTNPWHWVGPERIIINRRDGAYLHDFVKNTTTQVSKTQRIACLTASMQYGLWAGDREVEWRPMEPTSEVAPKTLGCWEGKTKGLLRGHGLLSPANSNQKTAWTLEGKLREELPIPFRAISNVKYSFWSNTYRITVDAQAGSLAQSKAATYIFDPATGSLSKGTTPPWIKNLNLRWASWIPFAEGDILAISEPEAELPRGVYYKKSGQTELVRFFQKTSALFSNLELSPSGCLLTVSAFDPHFPDSTSSLFVEQGVFDLCQKDPK